MQASKNLVDLANERGGPDNITVIAVHINKGEKPPKLSLPSEKKGLRLELILTILILLCLGIVIYNKYVEEEEPNMDDMEIIRSESEDMSEDEKEPDEGEPISDEEEEKPSERTDQQEDSLKSSKDDQVKNDDKKKKDPTKFEYKYYF